MADTLLITLTLAAMLLVVAVSFLPFLPAPLLLWGIGALFVALDGFARVSPATFALFTALMLLGTTTGLWMPPLGMKADGVSCWGTVGMLVGGLAGTFLIPLPVCGTLFGAILGALAFELMHARSVEAALASGKVAVKLFFAELVVTFVIAALMFALYVVALL